LRSHQVLVIAILFCTYNYFAMMTTRTHLWCRRKNDNKFKANKRTVQHRANTALLDVNGQLYVNMG